METLVLTTAAATTRMHLALKRLNDVELHRIQVEQAIFQAAVKEYFDIELLE